MAGAGVDGLDGSSKLPPRASAGAGVNGLISSRVLCCGLGKMATEEEALEAGCAQQERSIEPQN